MFNLGFSLPPFAIDFPPDLSFGLELSCDMSDPLDVSLGSGGGRTPSGPDPDADPDYDLG